MNPSNISEEPKFNVGDLVTYIYSSSCDTHPRVGLIIGFFKVEMILAEESPFTDHFYEYDVMWVGENYASIMFEMFLEKYEHEE
tara:strand:- start:383 stop:634 length:252 start_codon:yes stop_codon:yes gene_type:complete